MPNHTLFIADLHLNENQPKTVELFLRFLQTDATKADALYILGDLFKLWVGDDDNSKLAQTIKNALKELSALIPVYLMPGNRDFLLGKKFAAESGCILLADPTKINLYAKPTLLTHGDILCSHDFLHVAFRFITRPKFAIKLFLLLPLAFRAKFAQMVQRFTLFNKKLKSARSMDTTQKTIQKTMHKFAVKQLIFGHTHRARIINEANATRIIVLGDWEEDRSSVLVYQLDGTASFQLH
jgi:UDP-2,3-diacylglucosamine hydrolase